MADITKGKSEVHRKETIDTGRFKAPRIRETTSTMGQREYTIPEAIPNIHTNASTKAAALRLRETAADRLVPILVPTLPGQKCCLTKKRDRVQKAINTVKISMPPYYTPFRTEIQAFLAKIAFFVNIDG